MTAFPKTESQLKPVSFKISVDFESILKSNESNGRFSSKKYQVGNLAKKLHTNNQQKCIDCLKPRSNKNERECKNYGCDYFYVPNYQSFLFVLFLKLIVL